ncbi:unnamed protein product, partial [Polarella glacialis]
MADKEEARLPPRVARGLRPPELESSCARLRVPQAAAEAIRKLLLTLEVELTVFCLWTAQKTDGAKEGSALDIDEDLVAGAAVSAKYDDGNWCDAVVVDVDPFSGTAKITWEYDGTTSDIDLQDLKLKPSEEVLAIFGPLRQRKMAAVKVMAAAEERCPGLWTSELLEAMDELRGSVGEDASVDVQVQPLSPDSGLRLPGSLQKGFKVSARRAEAAAGCFMHVLSSSALFVVGSREQRTRG